MSGSMGSAGSVPVTRREFVMRALLGLAVLPFAGKAIVAWADRQQQLAEWTRQYRYLSERMVSKPMHGLDGSLFRDQYGRHWTASVTADVVQVGAGREHSYVPDRVWERLGFTRHR